MGRKDVYFCDNCGKEFDDSSLIGAVYTRVAHGHVLQLQLDGPGNEWCVECRRKKFKELVKTMNNWIDSGEL